MRQVVEKRIAKEREKAHRQNEVTSMLKHHELMKGHTKSAIRVEALRRNRESEERVAEQQLDASIIAAAQTAESKQTILDMEQKIAKELEVQHAKQVREDMNRRRICEGSDELKKLKIKLQAAEMNKLQKGQKLERIASAQEEITHDRACAAIMEVRRQAGLKKAEEVEEVKHENRLKAKELNLGQIAARETTFKEEEHRALMKDKAQIQKIVDKIAKEDKDTADYWEAKKKETQQMMIHFKEEDTRLKKERKEADDEENRKIEEYAQQKIAFQEKMEAEKKEAEAKKKAQLALLLGAAEEADRQAAELEYLRNELHREELEELNRRREEMKLRKRLEDRVEMHKAYENQMVIKSQRRDEELSKEMTFRDRLLKQFAENDRLEQLNDQKRRMKIQEHKKEVNRLWDEKITMIAEEEAKDKAALEAQRQEERERQQIIEQERQRLLATYAEPLKEYLPKGIFETDQDHTKIMGRAPSRQE